MSLEIFFTQLKQAAAEVLSQLKVRKAKSSRRQRPTLIEDRCRGFSLAEMQAATDNFDHKLKVGESSYGEVYKGCLDHGTLEVVIKRFNKSMSPRAGDEFQTSSELLCQLRHQNLVLLIGFCNEREERILVYEFMHRGSLASHLHQAGANPIPWKQRLEICIGAATGLHYLHTGAKRPIFNLNVKSANILLNKIWTARIGDFGLSKIGPPSMSKPKAKTKTATKILGTVGYMAPEYIKKGELTEKCDVFSFGIVLFEVLSGRLASEHVTAEKRSMVSWICKCIEDGSTHRMIDPHLQGRIAPLCLIEFVDVAFSCIHPEPSKRPSMGEVEATLELALELQEKADSVMKAANPHGHYTFEQVEFHVSVKDYDEYLDEQSKQL